MGLQLALFAGVAPPEAPPPCVADPIPEGPIQPSPRQMGLFDAQVRQLRAAHEALTLADLTRAVSLLKGLDPGLDPLVPSMLRRSVELRRDLERVSTSSRPARVAAHVEFGRHLATEGEPWSSLGRVLLVRAALELGPAEGVLAARLLLEAREPARARRVLLEVPGLPNAGTLFALGDVETALEDRAAARRAYGDAQLLDPFDPALDQAADEDVRGLPYLAEFEVEVDGEPRAWCAPVGIVAGILPRPRELAADLPLPSGVAGDRSVLLARARQFVDALVRAGSPDVQRSRESLLEVRRCMKRASAPLFAWYMVRQVGAS